ncbi:MAG: sigma-70 family RNA polymerase sigma factor [Rhodospirillales bacterium]|nr:sigma-70 family RNA polymerase sigma factor [Rhodospirillales bacterium]
MAGSECDDPAFLVRLRAREDAAYRQLVRRYHATLVGVAGAIIGSRAQGEEVVQDAWLAIFSGIDRFEGRSRLSTWIFSIVLNRARSRIAREGRLTALPALDGAEPGVRAVPAGEFLPDGHWRDPPRLWDTIDPERIFGGRQLWAHVQEAIAALPAGQRAVILLRDIEERSAEEACALLGISAENQRVLLHRARGKVRQTIDRLTLAEPEAARPAPIRAAPRAAGPDTATGLARRMLRALRAWLAGPLHHPSGAC